MRDVEKKKGYDQKHCLISGCRLHGRYVIQRILGEGGFGITYEGWDECLNIPIAIKEYFPVGKVYRREDTNEVIAFNQECAGDFKRGLERYVQEADILSKFYQEEGIVSVRDFFQENNTAYIIMEYLDGITLREFVKTNGKLSMEDVREIVRPIVKAMGMVHREGILHRDISPDNIMVTLDNKVKLIDFGSARDFCYEPEKTATVILRQGFAPIEQYQAHGEQGTWTDVYALCGTIYYLLTAQEPPDTMERIIVDHIKQISDYDVHLPKWQERAVMNGLGIYRDHRYSTMEEMWTQVFEPQRNVKWYVQIIFKQHEVLWKRTAVFLGAAGVAAGIWGGVSYGLAGAGRGRMPHPAAIETVIPAMVRVTPPIQTAVAGEVRAEAGDIAPEVTGIRISRAKKILNRQGLAWTVQYRYQELVPKGKVFHQSAKIQEDTDGILYVKLTVSKGKKPKAKVTQLPVTKTDLPQQTRKPQRTEVPKKQEASGKSSFRIDSGESEDFVPEQ